MSQVPETPLLRHIRRMRYRSTRVSTNITLIFLAACGVFFTGYSVLSLLGIIKDVGYVKGRMDCPASQPK